MEEASANEVEVEVDVSSVERLTSGQLREVVHLSGQYQRIKAEIADLEEEAKETRESIKTRKEQLADIADRITRLHLGMERDDQLDLFDGRENDGEEVESGGDVSNEVEEIEEVEDDLPFEDEEGFATDEPWDE